ECCPRSTRERRVPNLSVLASTSSTITLATVSSGCEAGYSSRAKHNGWSLTSRHYMALPSQPCAPSCRQRVEEGLGFLHIELAEALGEPAIDRSEKIARLLRLASIAPEPRHAQRCAQFPKLRFLLLGDAKGFAIKLLGCVGIPLP